MIFYLNVMNVKMIVCLLGDLIISGICENVNNWLLGIFLYLLKIICVINKNC